MPQSQEAQQQGHRDSSGDQSDIGNGILSGCSDKSESKSQIRSPEVLKKEAEVQVEEVPESEYPNPLKELKEH